MNIEDCLEKRFLIREEVKQDLIDKELKESDYDFFKAKEAFDSKDYKWTIVKCYYSMFHSAKAVCFKLGYREKKHFAVLIVLEELKRQGKLEREFVNYFDRATNARESADYQYNYSQEIAEGSLKIAEKFNNRMKNLLEETEVY